MSSIIAISSKVANYVFHMLSVAKCGYNNDYGNKYKKIHSKYDLDILKKNEKYITVCGGEHCGKLYSICVCIPASLNEDKLIDYYKGLNDLFKNKNLKRHESNYTELYDEIFSCESLDINKKSHSEFYNSFIHLEKEIIEISEVMINNYDIYVEKVWNNSEKEIRFNINELNKIFSKYNYTDIWEKELGYKYKYNNFYAVICNSIDNGPQAINISHNKNILGITNDNMAMAKLISHEFGIYIFKDILFDLGIFNDSNILFYYKYLEAIAEYYNQLVCGGCGCFDRFNEYIDFYKSLKNENPEISPKEMFIKAVELFEGCKLGC